MLTQLDRDLWCAEDDLYMPGKFHFPCRMTICRIGEYKLWVHSPIVLTEDLVQALEPLGTVTWLVAPNCFHHLRLADWCRRWPKAELWGPAGLASKRSDLTFSGFLGESEPLEWQNALRSVMLGGAPKMDETVFLHQQSRTLIVTDLVFNVRAYKTKRSWLIYAIAGTVKRFGQSRLWRMFVKDRPVFIKDVSTVLALDFDRLVMAHGQIIENDGKRMLRKALAKWFKGSVQTPSHSSERRSSQAG